MPPKRFEKMSKASQKKRKVEKGDFPTQRMKKAAPFGARDPGFVDLASAGRVMDTTGAIVLVATIAQGTTVNQRIGKKAQYKSFQIRGECFANGAATITTGSWILVYDRRPTGALPAITDILDTATDNSFNNDTNSGRFKIIRRQNYAFSGNATGPTESTIHDVDIYVKFKKQITFKAAGTGAIADIEMGSVYLITVGSTAAGTGAATATLGVRTRFIDV